MVLKIVVSEGTVRFCSSRLANSLKPMSGELNKYAGRKRTLCDCTGLNDTRLVATLWNANRRRIVWIVEVGIDVSPTGFSASW